MFVDRNTLGGQINEETISWYINNFKLSKYCQHLVPGNQCLKRAGHNDYPFPHQLDIYQIQMTCPISCTSIYRLYKCTILVSKWTKPEVIRRKHITHPMVPIPRPVFDRTDKGASTMGVNESPPSKLWSKTLITYVVSRIRNLMMCYLSQDI